MADDGDPPLPSRSKKASSWFSEKIFACCCVGFLNPNGSGSKEYYELLGVKKSASLAEIKKSYKKLSLAFHPDKLRQRGETLTDEMQEKFRKIKQAYEVTKMQEILNKADKRAYCVVASTFALVLGYVFLFPTLFALEVDGDISLSFALVFTPLWIVYSLVFITMLLSVARGKNERPPDLEDDQPWEDDDPLFPLRRFQILVVAKLDGGLDGTDGEAGPPWALVLVPYYLFECAQMYGEKWSRDEALEAARKSGEAADAKAAAAEHDEEANPMDGMGFDERNEAEAKRREAAVAWHQGVYFAFRLVQVLLIALHSDGVFEGESSSSGSVWWWLVLLPTMLYVALACCRCTSERGKGRAEAGAAAQMREEPLPPEATFKDVATKAFEENLKEQRAEHHGALSSQICFSCCCLALYLLLFGFYITEESSQRFSFFYFYLPYGILFGCPLLCVCCLAGLQEVGCIPEDLGDDLEGKGGGEDEDKEEGGLSLDNEEEALEKALKESLLSSQVASSEVGNGGGGGLGVSAQSANNANPVFTPDDGVSVAGPERPSLDVDREGSPASKEPELPAALEPEPEEDIGDID
eukprot:CAMPEP_0171845682 /NCGR_PEP_ID=MMETSP0992-20121227/17249_1 /TAXON_ID=483369 /ORGANISM="non described non described, Strain CCMP2098" /LENGTH=581 /DNA_ID=CAMNT_0012463793 /DNA_START=46 /DNA_END=1792 /DNA_ORIENTATION=-